MSKFQKGKQGKYSIAFLGNGVYAIVLEGGAVVNRVSLNRRDGIGIWDTDRLSIEASDDLQILLTDVPMID
jgi:quercetin 2,3-dioxygenase